MFRSELEQALKAMGLTVTDGQLSQFCAFNERLVETNKVMNLTAITDPKGVAIKHMADHKPEYRSAFDIVTSRAVARLNILAEWALPYVKTGGYFISLKGAQYEDELAEGEKALQILGGKVAEVRPVHLPGLDDVRAVLYIEKVKESPKKYPRKPKMAAKNPL